MGMSVRKVSVEEWAARLVSKELGVDAEVHDDNSSPQMYDVRVGHAESPQIAIECVGAVDPVRTETWNVGGPMVSRCASMCVETGVYRFVVTPDQGAT